MTELMGVKWTTRLADIIIDDLESVSMGSMEQ
jgi:hypothetical protein